MAVNPNLQPDDQFIVGKKSDNKTYKTTFENLKRDIGIHHGSKPTDPIDGAIWIQNTCPPQIFIYSECDPTDPNHPWYPITPPDTLDYLQKDADGNVYIEGNLYVTGDVDANQPGAPTSGVVGRATPTATGDVFITGSVQVGKQAASNYPTNLFNPVADQEIEDDGSMIVEGHLVVAGRIVSNYNPALPF